MHRNGNNNLNLKAIMMNSSNVVNHPSLKEEEIFQAAQEDAMPKPAPLVPEAYECRKLMRLYLDRDDVIAATEAAILDGDLTEICRMRMAAIAWKEKIPGSLPADDVKLSRLIFGNDLGRWLSMKDVLLRDWMVCANGRLYHPSVADAVSLSVEQYNQRADAARKGREAQAKNRAERNAKRRL
jgi:hypothetical protein